MFRMSNFNKLTNMNDPGLHMGLAYFVDQQPYLKHIRKYASQKEAMVLRFFPADQ